MPVARPRRREYGALVQKFQHVLPAPVLLGDGITRVTAEGSSPWLLLGAAEIVSATALIVLFVRTVRRVVHHRGEAHVAHGVDWVDIFVGVMLLVEATVHWHETAHVRRPTVLLGFTMITFGILHKWIVAKITEHHTLRVNDEGISVGERFFRRFSVRWPDVAEIAIGPATARILTRDGRERAFDLRDTAASAGIRGALVAAEARRQQQMPGALEAV